MKTVVITGAAGGMGAAAAKALAERGYTVFALDKRAGEGAPRVIPVAVDVTDAESVRRAFDAVRAQTDAVYAILHFAGVYRLDSLVEMSEARFVGAFDVNLFGVYRINKAFLPLLKEGSRIVITTSELAPLDPLPFTGVYAVTKAALEKYAASLRMELQLLGITVTVLRPGAVDTGLLGDSTRELDAFCENTKLYTCNAARFRKIVNRVEANNVPPERIARVALRALSARRPRCTSNANRTPLLRLMSALPSRWRAALLRHILK